MRVHLEYEIILTIDIPKGSDVRLKRAKPCLVSFPKFRVTENKPEDSWCKTHRKYVGRVTPEELEKLLNTEFYRTNKTMWMITFEGWKPAISFDGDTEDVLLNAYVCPVLPYTEEEELCIKMDDLPKYDKEEIETRVGTKLEQCLELLYNFYQYRKVGKSIHVAANIHQLHLHLEEHRRRVQ